MRYEIFLRATRPLDPQEQARIAEIGGQAGQSIDSELYREEGVVQGVDLSIDVGATEAVKQICDLAFALGSVLGLSTFDPQLGRAIGQGDREQIAARLDQMRAFAEAVPLSPPTTTPGARLWLAVAAAILGLLVLGRLILRCSL